MLGIAAFGKAMGGIYSHASQSALNRIANREAIARTDRNIEKRRAFIRQARTAMAENLTAGVATGASLDSSAFQGSHASLQTQTSQALNLDRRQRELDALNEADRQSAVAMAQRGSVWGGLGGMAGSMGQAGVGRS